MMRLSALFLTAALPLLPMAQAVAQTPEQKIQASEWLWEGDLERALPAYVDMTTQNPWDGELWYGRGRAEARTGDCHRALRSLDRSLELGVNGRREGLRLALYERAACRAATGQIDAAIADLETASGRWEYSDWSALASDERFADILDHPRLQEISGQLPDGLSREDGWSADLDFAVDLVRRRHINPFTQTSERDWLRGIETIRSSIATSSDDELTFALMSLFAEIGDGHTLVYPPFGGPNAFRLLPVIPREFDGDWVILSADPEYADLVGGHITAVNGVPIDRFDSAIDAFAITDNDMTAAYSGPMFARFTEVTQLMTGQPARGETQITVRHADGRELTREVISAPFNPAIFGRWAPADWPVMGESVETPLWLSNLAESFWMQHLAEHDAVYVQLNAIGDQGRDAFNTGVAQLGEMLDDTHAGHIILDLRHNSGGNGALNWTLIREIVRRPRFDEEGSLFILTSPNTFSAAQNMASQFEAHTPALFVGEVTGSRPNFYGESATSQLPYSGLTVSISNRYFQFGWFSDDARPWIAPDMAAPITVEALRRGEDPGLEAILDLIGR